MVLVTLTFPKDDVTPPVYIAGSFSNWQPIEMHHEQVGPTETARHRHTKRLDLLPGSHQYKYRLGSGNWWMVDDSVVTMKDENGNVNNIIELPHLESEEILARSPEKRTAEFPQRHPGPDEPVSPVLSSRSEENSKPTIVTTEASRSSSSTRKLVDHNKAVGSATQNELSQHHELDGTSSTKDDSNPSKNRQSILHKLVFSCCTTQKSVVIAGLVLVAAAYLACRD